jgi:hypothetical protein
VFLSATVLYPRFASNNASAATMAVWEDDPLHATVEGIFSRRNTFTHGKISNNNSGDFSPRNVASLWNSGLDVIERVELEWLARIAKSHHEKFRNEIAAFRIPMAPTSAP